MPTRPPARKRTGKTVAQRKEEAQEPEEERTTATVRTPEEVSEDEVLHGDIMQAPDGTVEIVNPVPIGQQLTSMERQRMAMNLRMMGASYQGIADQLGYADASGAYRAVQAGSKAALIDTAMDLRNMTLLQLQQLFLVHWPKAIKGDQQALVNVLQIQDRIRTLMALDGMPMSEGDSAVGVLVIGGDTDQYKEGLKKARKQAHGIED